MKQMTLKQYRTMDLVFFTLIMVVSQFVITLASSRWFADQLYVVSPVAAVVAIVLMRWDGWSVLPCIVGGVAFSYFFGGECKHFLIYAFGNCLALTGLLFLKHYGKSKVRSSDSLSLVYAAVIQVAMMLGRFLVSLLLGNGLAGSIGFITTDSLSVVFTLLIIWIARRVDGLFEDQLAYLHRVQKEEQTEGGNRT